MIRLINMIIYNLRKIRETLIKRSIPKGVSAQEWAKKNNKRKPSQEDLFNGH
tara:strand:- start:1282 stop:1437 length:156 start_codon:yes stop_codon:yes gene_type:complete